MRRLFFALLLTIFATTPVSAAKFYWKASTTDLNAIAAPSAGDRGIVITDAGAVSYWTYSGSAWVQAYASVPDLSATYAVVTGTPETTFQIDNNASGPLLKWDSGNTRLMLRNSGDSAYYDLVIKDLYVENINSTKANGYYSANYDNTTSISFTPAQGDWWSLDGVPYFRDATTNRKVLHAGSSAADFPTLNQNTTGTASNVSGTPALPNGTTATTQTQADNSTKLATTAYVDSGLSGKAATSHTHTEWVGWTIKDSDTATAVANGKQAFVVPAYLNGMNLTDLTCSVADLSNAASGTTTVVLRRVRGTTAANMTSTGVTISYDEATLTASDETVDTANDDIQTGDKIYVDVNAITSPAHKGLSCTASFQLP